MKKLVLCLLVFSLLFSPTAIADVVTIDLDDATVEELKAARDSIDKRLNEAWLANAPAVDDSFIITGKGTQILKGVDMAENVSRIVATCDDDIKVTYYTDSNSRTYNGSFQSAMCFADCVSQPLSISSIMVETSGNWTIDLSPIKTMPSPFVSGIGACVSDSFTVTPPCIVHITLTRGLYGGYNHVSLWKIHTNGRTSAETMLDNVLFTDKKEFDVIIKPEEDVSAYFWVINCPVDTTWEITAR